MVQVDPYAVSTATVAFRYLSCREPQLVRWEGQCMGAVGEPRKRPHCLMCLGYGETKTFKIKNALFRECWTRTLRVTASPTRVSLGVASCQSEILSLKKVVWRQWLVSKSRTKSSVEGCEQLLRRATSVARPSSSPSHARSVLSRTTCGRTDPPLWGLLAVKPQEVIPGQTKSADRWLACEANMRPVPVVAMEPSGQRGISLL